MSAEEQNQNDESLLERTALAALRSELGLLTPAQQPSRSEGLVAASEEHFDGQRLVELCLEGRASDDQRVLHRALLTLRSRFVENEASAGRPQRRKANIVVRGTATLTAKLIFSTIYTVVLVVLLIVLQHHWKWLNIYDFGSRALRLFGVEAG
jgi:hypothetical protein